MYFIYKLGSNVFHNGYFDTNANHTFVYGTFNCHGTENYLADCPWTAHTLKHCYEYEVAGVRCGGNELYL